MSILEDLLAAIKENTAATVASNEGRDRAIAAAEKVTTAKAPTAAEKKVAAEAAKVDAAAAAAASTPTTPTTTKAVAGAPTAESIAAAFAKLDDPNAIYTRDDVASSIVAYGNVTDEAEVAARKVETARILALVGAKKLSEIPETKYRAVVKAMRDSIDKGNLVATEEEADAEVGDDDEDNLLA